MTLLTVLLLCGGASGFLWLVMSEYSRVKMILDRKAFIARRRMVKLADLSHRRRKTTRLASGAEGPDVKAAAEMLAAMMGGHVVDRSAPAAVASAGEPEEPI